MVFRSISGFLFVTILFVCLMLSNDTLAASENPDVTAIQTSGKLRIIMVSQNQPPFFEETASGDLTGFDITLARSIAAELGVVAEFLRVATSFDNVVERLAAGEGDLAISYLSRTPQRMKKVDFTAPYLVLRLGFLIRNESEGKSADKATPKGSLSSAFNGAIGVEAGTSHLEFLRSLHPKASIREYPEWNDVFAALIRKDILVAFSTEFEFKQSLRENPVMAKACTVSLLSNLTDHIAIAVPKTKPHLKKWLNEYIAVHLDKITIDAVLEGAFSTQENAITPQTGNLEFERDEQNKKSESK